MPASKQVRVSQSNTSATHNKTRWNEALNQHDRPCCPSTGRYFIRPRLQLALALCTAESVEKTKQKRNGPLPDGRPCRFGVCCDRVARLRRNCAASGVSHKQTNEETRFSARWRNASPASMGSSSARGSSPIGERSANAHCQQRPRPRPRPTPAPPPPPSPRIPGRLKLKRWPCVTRRCRPRRRSPAVDATSGNRRKTSFFFCVSACARVAVRHRKRQLPGQRRSDPTRGGTD